MELPHQGKQTYEEPKVYALEPPNTNEPAALGFLEMEGWTKKNYDRSLKQGNSIPRITIKLNCPSQANATDRLYRLSIKDPGGQMSATSVYRTIR